MSLKNTFAILRCHLPRNYSRLKQHSLSRCLSRSSVVYTFQGEKDRFNGITVDTSKEKCDASNLQKDLEESLSIWKSEGRRCIWFKVNIKDSFCVPILADKGFNFHHAREDYLMMYRWLPESSSPNLPPSCYTNLGVGAMVFDNNKILAISEQHYEYPHWKLPGGYVERGEDLLHAAKREVKEETGIDTEFQSLVTFRHSHNMMFGNSDIYMLLMMKALSRDIKISQREVKDCQWMEVEDYLSHPHVHEWNRIVVWKALEYKKKKLKLDIQNKTVRFGPYERHMNFLMVEELK